MILYINLKDRKLEFQILTFINEFEIHICIMNKIMEDKTNNKIIHLISVILL